MLYPSASCEDHASLRQTSIFSWVEPCEYIKTCMILRLCEPQNQKICKVGATFKASEQLSNFIEYGSTQIAI